MLAGMPSIVPLVFAPKLPLLASGLLIYFE
jgi:hypothetical protein